MYSGASTKLLTLVILASSFLVALWCGHVVAKAENERGSPKAFVKQPISPLVVGKRQGTRVVPSRLPSKALAAVGGGDADTQRTICGASYAFSPGTEVFGFFPSNRFVELNKPHVIADLLVEACHRHWNNEGNSSSEYAYVLRDPLGNVVGKQWGDSFWFDFPADAVTGEYTLAIDGSGIDTLPIYVSQYKYPRLELTDPATHENRAMKIGGSTPSVRNSGVNAHFYGFAPGAELEIGLYFMNLDDAPISYEVVDSWLATANEKGEYQKTLSFAAGTPPGEYMLIGCALDACNLMFSQLLSEPFGPPNAVRVPPLAWESLSLEEGSVAGSVEGSVEGSVAMEEPSASNFMRCDGPCNASSTHVNGPAPAKSTALNFQWQYANIPVGARYTRSWSVPGKGEWIRYECEWPGPSDGVQRVRLTEPKGLYSGTWELVVTVEGQEILHEAVEVDGNWTYWDPAGVITKCQ